MGVVLVQAQPTVISSNWCFMLCLLCSVTVWADEARILGRAMVPRDSTPALRVCGGRATNVSRR